MVSTGLRHALAFMLATALLVPVTDGARAQQDTPNYPTSPYHGVTDGNGNVIPCRCRYRGERVELGTLVCMQTAGGTFLARCDLVENNTSWVPTRMPCEMSQLPGRGLSIAARDALR